ncbi:MAG: outer membrane lipoprotein-sorting protein [Spirochaetales bacterium]|nr:MAG: outer membrane lipoprotein-sorting protein [Spirochaetales bacterium]
MIPRCATALVLFFAVIVTPLTGQTVTNSADPAEILRGAALLGQFSSLETRMTMDITDSRGAKKRDLAAYVERKDDETKALVQVVSPAFLSNLKFLSIASEAQRDQWISTSRGVRRIAGGTGNEKIFDSDFTVEDLSSYDPEDYAVTLQGTEVIGGVECHVIQAVPNETGMVDRKILYVATGTGLLQSGEFYKDGVLDRTFALIEYMELDGVPFPRVARMTTVTANTFTILTVTQATSGEDIPDRLFNRSNL